MPAYIALLRGINVSGHKLIKMERLREVLSQSGFLNVRTYIQSGNILFESGSEDTQLLQTQIHKTIADHFSFDVPVTVITPELLRSVIKNNPFLNETAADPTQPYVAFLSASPATIDQETLAAIDFGFDRYKIVGNSIYLHYAASAGKTKLTNSILEKKLKVSATSRNWKTVLKLAELTEK